MGACRVRYLRCPADHLPAIPELQLLVPQRSHASRGPQPAEGLATVRGAAHATGPGWRRRERSSLWPDSIAFSDSLFAAERGFDTGHVDLRALDNLAFDRPAAIVRDDPTPLPQAPHPPTAVRH